MLYRKYKDKGLRAGRRKRRRRSSNKKKRREREIVKF